MLFLITAIGGANYTILKMLVPEVLAPNAMVLMRILLGFVFFSLCTYPNFGFKMINRKDALILLFCSVFGVVGNQFFFYQGMARTLPINGSIFNLSMPITIWLLSTILYKAKVTWIALLGFIVSLSGALLLLDWKAIEISNTTFIGDLCILINAISFGTYVVLVAPLSKRINAFKISQIIFGIGLIIYTPIGITDLIETDWQKLMPIHWFCFSYIIIGTTFIVYYLNNLIPKIADTRIIALYVYLQPVIAALVAIYVRGDILTFQTICCGILIGLGIYIAQHDSEIMQYIHGERKKT